MKILTCNRLYYADGANMPYDGPIPAAINNLMQKAIDSYSSSTNGIQRTDVAEWLDELHINGETENDGILQKKVCQYVKLCKI